MRGALDPKTHEGGPSNTTVLQLRRTTETPMVTRSSSIHAYESQILQPWRRTGKRGCPFSKIIIKNIASTFHNACVPHVVNWPYCSANIIVTWSAMTQYTRYVDIDRIIWLFRTRRIYDVALLTGVTNVGNRGCSSLLENPHLRSLWCFLRRLTLGCPGDERRLSEPINMERVTPHDRHPCVPDRTLLSHMASSAGTVTAE